MKEQIQHQLDDGELEADHIETAGGRSLHDTAERDDTKRTLFWSFPRGRGRMQPWRRRLWELQNNSDGE
ncbi:hypothetical protein MHI24_11710 [Paenibacillus sp. FSL K6-1096]|uniref:hypothetical protein n=1 Tax=Paenibacillus sp. FSL K6-1096 TaxID=2921460 RepID=UPI0030ECB030